MRKIKNQLLLGLLFLSFIGFSQNPERLFESFSYQNNILEIKVNDGYYRILPYSKNIIETSFIPAGETYQPESHAVILKPEHLKSEVSETPNSINLTTPGIEVHIQKQPFQISYFYKAEPLLSEKLGYVKNDSLETIQFNLKDDEVLYGGGARALGMNRRGHRLQLYNRAHYGYETHSELMNYTMPIVLSSQHYMVHFDNVPIGFLDLDSGQKNILTYETISGRKTYQVIASDTWKDLVEAYTDLTGKQPMPPRWTLGNFASRFGYHSQREVEAVVKKFRKENIPLDAIIIDIFWFGKDIQGHMGNLEFLKDSFPHPKQMIKNLKTEDVNTILVTEPFILTTSNRWDEVISKDVMAKDSLGNPFTYDFYFGNTGLIDIYNPKGKAWFWDIYKGLAEMGITGIWGDLGEPEVHPSALIHATGTADEVHNSYGHDWAGLIAEGYKRDFPTQRPFILMRAGYSGSQRYGMIPWSGDVNRTWGGLQSQPEIALQMGMQGLGYMHTDLGGFAGNNQDPELYTRWLQYGVFQPIFRPHAQEDVPAEPIFWDAKTKALAKKTIELRYKLLPYNYNLSFENHVQGTPLMRPLFFEDDTANLQTDASAYLWGNDFLVAPVLEPGITTKTIYFPKNSNWFDFYSDKKYEGGQTTTVNVEIDKIPTYVRGGAFIPMAYPMQSTKDYDGNRFLLHYYEDNTISQSQGQLYNDDGLTADTFENGNYELLKFGSDRSKELLEITLKSEIGKTFSSTVKNIDLSIHNIKRKPKSVKRNGKQIKFTYDQEHHIISIPVQWNPSEILKLTINLK